MYNLPIRLVKDAAKDIFALKLKVNSNHLPTAKNSRPIKCDVTANEKIVYNYREVLFAHFPPSSSQPPRKMRRLRSLVIRPQMSLVMVETKCSPNTLLIFALMSSTCWKGFGRMKVVHLGCQTDFLRNSF